MRIEFCNTLDDYRAALAGHRKKKGNRQLLVLLVSMALIIGATCAHAFLFSGPELDWTATVICLALFTLLWPAAHFSRERQIRRSWEGQPNEHLYNCWDFSEEGIRADNGTSVSEMKWTAFRDFVEEPALFMLYVSEPAFQIIPKRAFSGDEQLEEFRNLLRRHVQARTQAFPVISPADSGTST